MTKADTHCFLNQQVHLHEEGTASTVGNFPVSLLLSLVFHSSCCISVPKIS